MIESPFIPADSCDHRVTDALSDNSELWDHFVRKEEYADINSHYRSYYGRNDIAYLRPSVSSYLKGKGLKIDYPENRSFAVCLTHDIDYIYPPVTHTLWSGVCSAKDFDIKNVNKHLFWMIKGKEKSPYRNFYDIIRLEKDYDAVSSFYFRVEDDTNKDRGYDIFDLENDLGRIMDCGNEIGLHGGYSAFDDLECVLREKTELEKALNRKITGFRNHYLLFKVPRTWSILSKAGFKYDTTFGYNDMIGCRNGMCHPFRPFDLISGNELDIYEIPLTIMDVSLISSGKTFHSAWEVTKNLIDDIERCRGVVTLLWHNNIFASSFRKEWVKLYVKILDYCYAKDAWMTSAENIYGWWNRNVG